MKETTAQKRVWQFLFIVRGDDDDRAVGGADRFARLIDMELHPIEFLQKVVRKFDVGLVDLINQKDDFFIGLKRLPELTFFDVVFHVMDAFVA